MDETKTSKEKYLRGVCVCCQGEEDTRSERISKLHGLKKAGVFAKPHEKF